MNYTNVVVYTLLTVLLVGITGCTSTKKNDEASEQKKGAAYTVGMILGSTRQGRSSEKIAKALAAGVVDRSDVHIQILDLSSFNLPFLVDEVAPASRKTITDPAVQRWSDAVRACDAFIIVVPEYNGGYPGVLKNALDSLYVEWNNKPVGFVGYSGGPSGAAGVVAQLETVANYMQMKPVATHIAIPTSWKAFNEQGALVDAAQITQQLNRMLDELRGSK